MKNLILHVIIQEMYSFMIKWKTKIWYVWKIICYVTIVRRGYIFWFLKETKYEWPSREFERRKDSRCVPSCPSESLFGMLCLMLWSHWFELQRKRKEIVVLIGKAKMKSTSYYHTRVFICGNLKKRIVYVEVW
jgi:hypothetical protein